MFQRNVEFHQLHDHVMIIRSKAEFRKVYDAGKDCDHILLLQPTLNLNSAAGENFYVSHFRRAKTRKAILR